MHLAGKITDYGDLVHIEQWVVKGRRLRFVWHLGLVVDTQPAARRPGASTSTEHHGKDLVMDLMADKQVTLSASFTDELGHPVQGPAGATVTYTVDDGSIINLTDNGDGTAVAAAVGTLGQATVHATVEAPGIPTLSGDLLIVVVEGLAERFEITAGPPEESTPDTTG